MIKRYNNLSFIFIPGVIVQVFAYLQLERSHTPAYNLMMLGLAALGASAVMLGFSFYARAKGRSGWWGLAGFLGLPGLLILAILKDKSNDPWNT